MQSLTTCAAEKKGFSAWLPRGSRAGRFAVAKSFFHRHLLDFFWLGYTKHDSFSIALYICSDSELR